MIDFIMEIVSVCVVVSCILVCALICTVAYNNWFDDDDDDDEIEGIEVEENGKRYL